MKKSKKFSFEALKNMKVVGFAVAAVLLGGGSFVAASGLGITGPSSLMAAVSATVSGQPTVLLSRASNSPKGSIPGGSGIVLATYDVKAYNVKWQATIDRVQIAIPITGDASGAKSLTLSSFKGVYTYCVKNGVTYGYGYKGKGNCSERSFEPTTATRSGNAYVLTFDKTLPVYLNQYGGQLTISSAVKYVNPGMRAAIVQANVASVRGVGDQCRTVNVRLATRTYGYQKCGNTAITANFAAAKGNPLVVKRPPGYGYKVAPIEPTPPGKLPIATTTATTTKPSILRSFINLFK